MFLSRAAYFTANGAVDIASTVSVTTENGAEIANFDLEILQVAKAHKISGGAEASKTADLNHAGVISIGTGATTAEITITADMSLSEIAAAINTKTTTTGIQASVLQVADGDYRMVMTTAKTGQTITASEVGGGTVLTDLGVITGTGTIANELQASQQAQIKVDGVLITRSSNDISDVVSGATIRVYQETPANTSVKVEIGANLGTIKSAVLGIVEAYNAYRDFAYKQQQLPSGNNQETTVLFGDSTLRNANTNIGNALIGSIRELSLGTIGLTMDNENKLVLDEAVLDNALLTNPDQVKDLLAFKMTSSSPDLLLLERGTEQLPPFKLDIVTDANGLITSASVNGDASLFTISGTRLLGKAGSIYDGYAFVYAGNTSQSVDLSFSAGIAEQLYNATDAVANTSDGSLSIMITGLKETNEEFQTKSDDIRAQTETYKAGLVMRYAKYQAAIAAAESSQDYLKSLLDTWNNPS